MGKADHATPKWPRAVLDPNLSDEQREAVEWFLRNGEPLPTKGALRRSVQLGNSLAVLSIPGMLLLAIGVLVGGWAALVLAALGVALVTLAILPILRWVGFHRRESAAGRLVEQSKGGYILPDALDKPARKLLTRAQKAIRTVLRSQIHDAGLLDRVHNEVLLPSVEWDLAQMLRNATRLRAEHPELEGEQSSSGARSAYEQAQQTILRHVEGLARYADRVLAADIAYQMAGGDRSALADLEILTEAAGAAEQAFRGSLEDAYQAALQITS